ncbi:MAG: GTP 3',8-cyclase MoaA [Candidatus Binatia bacterium]|nr:GTP 3',8-cyclase MoaA [Candidatus Binatia bacterium]
MPRDRFGRAINYLRISVIDHCNLRCVYCMPLQGLRLTRPDELLTAEEIEKVAKAAAMIGFSKVRITGGEPTMRPDLEDIVRRIASIESITDLSMTTNGILLPKLAERLRRAGLRRVNVHIDSLHSGRLQRVMRFGTVEEIWAGLEAAQRAGFAPIKLNAVVTRGYNEDDVIHLAQLTVDRDWHVRFIELMPLGGGEEARIAVAHFVSNEDTLRRLELHFGALEPVPSSNPADEAVYYRVPGARGLIGLISPVSRPYCGTCNRMRLTADGKLHLCLLHDDEVDVRGLLRAGASAEDLAEVIMVGVKRKPTGHSLQQGIAPADRSMYQIGG